MSNSTSTLSAISLFVEDLDVAKFENLLKVENAAEIVEPGLVAQKDAGTRSTTS